MRHQILYRNARAGDLLDVFLVSAITSLLLVRFYLYITGYPQLGNGSLHIAHMLWGGLLMMAAIVITLSFLGIKSRQLAAVIGGAGFGVFIDELGKFITEDNNYFFAPTIGLIYAIFVALYLLFNYLTRAKRLSSRENQVNALVELEEAVASHLDRTERARLEEFLASSSQRSPITKHLKELVATLEITAPEKSGRLSKLSSYIDEQYKRFWQLKGSNNLVRFFFGAEVGVLAAATFYSIYTGIDDIKAIFDGTASYGEELLIAQIGASLLATGFLIYGLSKLRYSRLEAFHQFKNAALVNIYLTQFFVFIRVQFEALPGFILNLIVLLLIVFVIRQELRLNPKEAHA